MRGEILRRMMSTILRKVTLTVQKHRHNPKTCTLFYTFSHFLHFPSAKRPELFWISLIGSIATMSPDVSVRIRAFAAGKVSKSETRKKSGASIEKSRKKQKRKKVFMRSRCEDRIKKSVKKVSDCENVSLCTYLELSHGE